MAQITMYLPNKLEERARKAAKAKRTSVSRWIADQVVRSLEDTWSKGVIEAAGAFRDFPTVKQIRRGYGRDARRGSLD